GPMLTWLKSDLASTTQRWIVAFWNQPPYDSDADPAMTELRANVLPILEAGGVDLVLTSSNHAYERSFLLDGHYGSAGTFTAAMKKAGGKGREDGTGAYRKPATGASAHAGTVYVVRATRPVMRSSILPWCSPRTCRDPWCSTSAPVVWT